MSTSVTWVIISLSILAINFATMHLMFPRRYGLPVTVGVIVLFTAAYLAVLYFTDSLRGNYGGLRGLVYLPLIAFLFTGPLYKKLFAFLFQMLMTMLQFSLVEAVVMLFMSYGSREYYAVLLAATLIVFAGYAVLLFIFGRRVFDRLFAHGRLAEWTVYSLGATFSFVVLLLARNMPVAPVLYIFLLLFILWSFGVLCFSIINTHEKTKQRYEVELARDIISSGSVHYQKMHEMLAAFRVMRGDFKYHLVVIRGLLGSDKQDEIGDYINSVEKQLSESETPVFCKNPVVNALLAVFSEQCAKQNTVFTVKTSMPEAIPISDYEMCIVLGNLLENAVEACGRQLSGRKIEVHITSRVKQLGIKVANSFDGTIMHDNGQPVSTKKDGGLGLRGVRAVAARYGGELITEWDDKAFTAYVLMQL